MTPMYEPQPLVKRLCDVLPPPDGMSACRIIGAEFMERHALPPTCWIASMWSIWSITNHGLLTLDYPGHFLVAVCNPNNDVDKAVSRLFDQSPENTALACSASYQTSLNQALLLLSQSSARHRILVLDGWQGTCAPDLSAMFWSSGSTSGPWRDWQGKVIRHCGSGVGGQVMSRRPSGYISQVILLPPTNLPLAPSVVRHIRDECDEAGVPFVFGGWGGWYPASQWESDPERWLPFGSGDELEWEYWTHCSETEFCWCPNGEDGDLLDGKRHREPMRTKP